MKSHAINREGGFSLIELLIVIVIIGVATSFAIYRMGNSKTDFERQRISREFKNYLERARFDSVKRRADNPANMARVVLNGPSSFTARLDFDEDGVIGAGEIRFVDFAARTPAQILVSGALIYPITLRFDQRGHITATDGGGNPVNPLFRICSDCATASPDETIISISTTGTVAMIRDGQNPGALPTPSVVNSAQTINCYVLYTNSNTSCSLN